MKKTLLLSAIALVLAFSTNAQVKKIWNLGGDVTVAANGAPAFALTTGIGLGDGTTGNPAFPVANNGLLITGISTNLNMGAVNASPKTFTDASSVSYSFPNRFQLNGAGYTGAANTDLVPLVNMPTQRYLSFKVTGNSTIYAIGVTGSNASSRSIFVTDGTNYVGKIDFPSGSGALNDGTINYTGPATYLYLFGNQSCNLCYLSVTNYDVKTSVNKVLSDNGVTFNGLEVVNTKGLEIELYNVLGKKIAVSKTNISIANLRKGVYLVKAQGINETLKFTK